MLGEEGAVELENEDVRRIPRAPALSNCSDRERCNKRPRMFGDVGSGFGIESDSEDSRDEEVDWIWGIWVMDSSINRWVSVGVE